MEWNKGLKKVIKKIILVLILKNGSLNCGGDMEILE